MAALSPLQSKKKTANSPLLKLLAPKYKAFLKKQGNSLNPAQKKLIAAAWHQAEQGILQQMRAYETRRQQIFEKYTTELLSFTRNERQLWLRQLEATMHRSEAAYQQELLQKMDAL